MVYCISHAVSPRLERTLFLEVRVFWTTVGVFSVGRRGLLLFAPSLIVLRGAVSRYVALLLLPFRSDG